MDTYKLLADQDRPDGSAQTDLRIVCRHALHHTVAMTPTAAAMTPTHPRRAVRPASEATAAAPTVIGLDLDEELGATDVAMPVMTIVDVEVIVSVIHWTFVVVAVGSGVGQSAARHTTTHRNSRRRGSTARTSST